MIVGTGRTKGSTAGDCPGEAAPKHVFVTRTAKNTTSDIVENCLDYLTGIKGKAVCVTPEERKDNSYSLSWRVEIPAADLEKALQPDSWATGWAVREYFFRRQRQAPAEWKQPSDGQQPVAAAGGQRLSAH